MEMTATVEAELVTPDPALTGLALGDAVRAAGIGGRIRRSNKTYVVGFNDHDGEWTVAIGTGAQHSLSAYTAHGWEVTAISDIQPGITTATNGEESQETPAEDTEPEAPQVLTFQQFFESLPLFSIIRDNTYEYVFCGWTFEYDTEDGNETRCARMVNMRYVRTIETYRPNHLVQECNLTRVTNGEGGFRTLTDDFSVRMLRHYLSAREEARAVEAENIRVNNELSGYIRDYETLNFRINAYAEEMNMCSDYERRIFGWNDGTPDTRPPLQHKLQGRPKDYQVPVMIPTLHDEYLCVYPIRAGSPDAALDIVKGMQPHQVIANLVTRGNRFNQLEIQTEGEGIPRPTF